MITYYHINLSNTPQFIFEVNIAEVKHMQKLHLLQIQWIFK
jgi:hypothetical protein